MLIFTKYSNVTLILTSLNLIDSPDLLHTDQVNAESAVNMRWTARTKSTIDKGLTWLPKTERPGYCMNK